MNGTVQLDPAAIRAVAARLDALSARLERDLESTREDLTLAPAGADEVSGRATQTVNAVSAQYQQIHDSGAQELRKLAATLRAHTRSVERVEDDNATMFEPGTRRV
ncbi:PE family protein [Nocardia sp. NPDC049220]|uniref:PE family protein n=1 Tax=Nocardia sp. NPDC049220 TaxID=3155273 RepID=UPI0033EC01C3